MNISIKESMIIRKCLNNYVLEHNLEYAKSPLFNDLIHKLNSIEEDKVFSEVITNAKELIKKHDTTNVAILRNITKNVKRKEFYKDLKKYNFQSITNKKILELMESERVELINDNEIIK